MGKTRDIIKKIKISREHFIASMGRMKDGNSKDLTKAKEIKKKWQKHMRTVQTRL